MKKILLFSLLTLSGITSVLHAQETTATADKYTAHNKGKFYVYWGGNRESFSRSDIHFTGANYDFTLYDVSAHDKPKGYHMDYLNPSRMTIPQTNFRMGYYLTDHYNVSIGLDHMKYVMFQDRIVNYTGTYPNVGSYNETVLNNPNQVNLTPEFLKFEHTDGLNYINTEICRVDDVSKWFGIRNTDKFQINITEGVGGGILLPKTNATLLGKARHDDFHVSGYGVAAKVGLNLTFFKYFFVQAELKQGYINMPDIRTTNDPADRASQHFTFTQRIIVFGGIFKI
ncbi:MAG: hypothetical protein RL427_781 [Bacteroidota bacterium]